MKLLYDADDGLAGRGAIGLIVLETDETMEPEMAPIFARADVSVYHSRIPFDPVVAPETLANMAKELTPSARLLPKDIRFDAVGYGCTSAATVIGPRKVASLIQDAVNTQSVTEPISAALAAFRALKAQKIGFLTPYRADVSAKMRELFEREGFEISGFATFEEEEDHKVALISEASVLEGMRAVGTDCDLVFSACTNLRSFGVIEQAEQELDVPIVSSNSALAWHLGQMAGHKLDGPGRLFRL